MILQFSVTNFRSIKEKVTLDFRPSSKFSSGDLNENIIEENSDNLKLQALKSMVIYGANASGKSNLLRALRALEYLVEYSSDFRLDQPIHFYKPFSLCSKSKTEPTEFEIDFAAKNKTRYVYKIAFDKVKVIREELYYYPDSPKSRKTLLFLRDENISIKFGTHYKGSRKFDLYPNQLVLSQAGNRPIASLIEPYKFFSKYIYCSTFHDSRYDDALINSFGIMLSQGSSTFRENLNKIIRAADAGVEEIIVKEYDETKFKFPENIPQKTKDEIVKKFRLRLNTIHNTYDDGELSGTEAFDLNEESTGTIKLIVVGGLILDALEDGSTLVIDELDKSLHPILTRMLIGLFNSTENNPNNAQLIIATHDVSLLDRDIFRLDQIIITNKDIEGVTTCQKLSSFTDISKVTPLEKWYMFGRFGGTPMLDEFALSLNIKKEQYEAQQIY